MQGEQGQLESPEAAVALLRLVLTSGDARISSASLDDRTVWIKRYDVGRRPLAKWLHEIVSPLLPLPLRSSPAASASGRVDRELRKMEAFRAAGFEVPDLLFRNGGVMVLSHVTGILQQDLKRLSHTDPGVHDALLVGAAAALGEVHSAGLVHGRPHTRDMFVSGGRWGFVDFEEEPEAVMPLRAAQARDLWLMFLQISTQAKLPETEDTALSAYLESGPGGSLSGLQQIVGTFSPLLPLLFLLDRLWLGKDGRRLLKATLFLRGALARLGTSAGMRKDIGLGAAEGVKEGP